MNRITSAALAFTLSVVPLAVSAQQSQPATGGSAMSHDAMHHGSMSGHAMSHDAMHHGSMSGHAMSHDTMSKHDAMHHGAMSANSMKGHAKATPHG